jgi:hypothetical protein
LRILVFFLIKKPCSRIETDPVDDRLQVLDQSGEGCPPLSTLREFANNCNSFLCDICGVDILHVRCHFKLKKREELTAVAPLEAAPTRRSAAQATRDWPWDVCYDCMQAVRTGFSSAQKKELPGKISVVQVYTVANLSQVLSRVQALHESAHV